MSVSGSNRLRRLGPLALALSAIGFGGLMLAVGHVVPFWDPAPAWLPAPKVLAVGLGVLLVGAGTGRFFRRTRAPAAWGLLVYDGLWVLASLVDVVHHFREVGYWDGLCIAVTAFLGVFLISSERAPSERTLFVVRALFGAACVGLGVAHFGLAEYTASVIPPWFPARLALTYFTGAAHIAAGLALLAQRLDRLAVTMEAAMIGLFVLFVHIPSLVVSPPPAWVPTPTDQWSELFAALSVGGAAATLADALRRRPWGWRG